MFHSRVSVILFTIGLMATRSLLILVTAQFQREIGVFLNGAELSLNSAKSRNLINH